MKSFEIAPKTGFGAMAQAVGGCGGSATRTSGGCGCKAGDSGAGDSATVQRDVMGRPLKAWELLPIDSSKHWSRSASRSGSAIGFDAAHRQFPRFQPPRLPPTGAWCPVEVQEHCWVLQRRAESIQVEIDSWEREIGRIFELIRACQQGNVANPCDLILWMMNLNLIEQYSLHRLRDLYNWPDIDQQLRPLQSQWAILNGLYQECASMGADHSSIRQRICALAESELTNALAQAIDRESILATAYADVVATTRRTVGSHRGCDCEIPAVVRNVYRY